MPGYVRRTRGMNTKTPIEYQIIDAGVTQKGNLTMTMRDRSTGRVMMSVAITEGYFTYNDLRESIIWCFEQNWNV